ncbi:MAG: aspartate kinase [Nitrospirota bacterium]
MALIVQKYGGTSVGDMGRIASVVRRVIAAKEAGDQIVVVVSAMAGETDRLIRLAQSASSAPNGREMDMLLSTGERVTTALLAMALEIEGVPARSFSGRQAGIITDSIHTNARIAKINVDRLKATLSDGIVPIVAGFQGINEQSDVTTLGRGGSDLTAVALAAVLHADRCDIYTDVDGVYTADPNMVSSARKLSKISYEEMLEMASLGAKVLQARSVQFAMKYQVPVRVRSSFSNDVGTLVTKEDSQMEEEVVSGVACDKNQAKITLVGVPDHPGIASKIFSAIAEGKVVIDMIIQNVGQGGLTDLSFTVPKGDANRAKKILSDMKSDIGIESVALMDDIAKVSIVGVGMRSHSGTAAKMFSTLAAEGINILMIATSEIKISCVVDAKYAELSVRSLHEAFGLGKAVKVRQWQSLKQKRNEHNKVR